MKSLSYSSSSWLSCAKCGGEVIICVSGELTASGKAYIEGTIVSVETSLTCKGCALYTYGIIYEEGSLLDPNVPLVEDDVNGVLCKGCLTDYIEALASDSWISWSPTVTPLGGTGTLDSITTNTRYTKSLDSKYITIAGHIHFDVVDNNVTGIKFTLPFPHNTTYYPGGGCMLFSDLLPPGASIYLYEDAGIYYGVVVTVAGTNFSFGESYVAAFSLVYEAL